MKKKKTNDVVEILRNLHGNDPVREARVEEELMKIRLLQMFVQMREEAGITQAELARRMRTTQSVISRIESGNYQRITISTLLKAAVATNHKLKVTAETC